FAQQVIYHPTKNVAADLPNHTGLDAHLGQVHGRVGRTAADGEKLAIGHDQFASGGEMANRRTNKIGPPDAGAQKIGMRTHGNLKYRVDTSPRAAASAIIASKSKNASRLAAVELTAKGDCSKLIASGQVAQLVERRTENP